MTTFSRASGRIASSLVIAFVSLLAAVNPGHGQTITTLRELTQTLETNARLVRDIRLNLTVCAASRPESGVLVVHDDSGFELLEMGHFDREIRPGEKINIQQKACLLRRRDVGIQISAMPVADNDGIHVRRTWPGTATLKAGLIPIQVEWFNNLGEFNLELTYATSNSPAMAMGLANLCHAEINPETGHTNFLPGLMMECYEGGWEKMPDFDLLRPVKTGVATNLDIALRDRDEKTGMRFAGFFNVPKDGEYFFRLRSDDGSLLFLGDPTVKAVRSGFTDVPMPVMENLGKIMNSLTERRWLTVEGRVGFVTRKGVGLEFELHSDHNVVSVRVADATGLDAGHLHNSRVRITGLGRGMLTTSQLVVLGAVMVAGAPDVVLLEDKPVARQESPISSISAVQSLPLEEARQALPVRVHGVVTDSKDVIYQRLMSIQDDQRGIFVVVTSITNGLPSFGEFVEIRGHSGAGDFAPVIIADEITTLGAGQPPEPVRPTWTELLNGSMDVQWAEIQGVVTAVRSNSLSLLMTEGQMSVNMDGYDQVSLENYLKSVVRIRGVLYAMWNATNREVRVGSVMMRNASISVEASAPDDPFDAVVKTPRELLLFDPQATAFRRVKVHGQIIYADASQLFLQEGGVGIRVLPSERNKVIQAGDLVEAVGYPDISRAALLLPDAMLRKIGDAPLPPAKVLKESESMQNYLDATRVKVDGRLLGWHMEHGSTVLEMQSGRYLYLARISPRVADQDSLRSGSRLELTGVYVGRGRGQNQNTEAEAFELLINSNADIKVLSQPSWWTLQRLLILMGGLLVVLVSAAIWITQLRRLVEQRTHQLTAEIKERERIERKHALEAERSRIARDLHDDLGSSLTEISVLASTGQRPRLDENVHARLFRSIAAKARGLIAALDVIVWAVDPEENSLQSFADYVASHAEDFFSHTNIACRFKVPVSFPQTTLEGRVRHDLLMAVKEALNNIVRHAEATEVEFRMAVEEGSLMIDIADNGKGFEGVGGGHGLKNLPARLLKLGGTCSVESHSGGGTTVKIRLPLMAARNKTEG